MHVSKTMIIKLARNNHHIRPSIRGVSISDLCPLVDGTTWYYITDYVLVPGFTASLPLGEWRKIVHPWIRPIAPYIFLISSQFICIQVFEVFDFEANIFPDDYGFYNMWFTWKYILYFLALVGFCTHCVFYQYLYTDVMMSSVSCPVKQPVGSLQLSVLLWTLSFLPAS